MCDCANLAAKPIIIATNILNSMKTKATPDRHEASDIASAVNDGVDCLMLTTETAEGNFPAETVSMLSKVIAETEKNVNYSNLLDYMIKYTPTPTITPESVAASSCQAASELNIDLIAVVTETGRVAWLISKYRPKQNILACSLNRSVVKQCQLTWGLHG